MNIETTLAYREAIRDFMQKFGSVAEVDQSATYKWDRVSTFGWNGYDYKRTAHTSKCGFIIPDGATLEEHTYSMFAGTFVSNEDEVGVEAYPAHCTCGKYQDLTLRWVGTVGEILQIILKDKDEEKKPSHHILTF